VYTGGIPPSSGAVFPFAVRLQLIPIIVAGELAIVDGRAINRCERRGRGNEVLIVWFSSITGSLPLKPLTERHARTYKRMWPHSGVDDGSVTQHRWPRN
jgi:hypothetical protein